MKKHSQCVIAFALAALSSSPTVLSAQTMHLPPMSRQVLDKGTVVLALQAESTKNMTSHRIGVQENQIVVEGPTGQIDFIPLADRTLRDVVTDLRSRYSMDLTAISTNFPLYSARIVGDKELTPLCTRAAAVTTCNLVTIEARADISDVAFGFGLVMSPPALRKDTDTGLLESAGSQLDVIGGLQLFRPKVRPKKTVPRIAGQVRLALGTGQQLNVTTEQSGNGGAQVETVLQQADQIALTFQTPVVWRLVESSMDFMLTPLFGVNWTRLESFQFPSITVGTTQQTAASLFDKTRIAEVQRLLDRSLPLAEEGILAMFSFRSGENPLFYIGGGLDWHEGIERRIAFTRDNSGAPALSSLVGVIETPNEKVWRLVAGWRVLNVVDLRLDAAGPIGGRERDPVLKLLIGRDFPLTREQ